MIVQIVTNEDFSIRNNFTSMPLLHAHLDHELYYLKSGESTYFINDKIHPVNMGAFVFIPKGSLHKTQYDSNNEAERILLKINPEFFSNEQLSSVVACLSQSNVFYPTEESLHMFEELFAKIEKVLSEKSEHSKLLYNLYCAEILTLLCEFSTPDNHAVKPTSDPLVNSVYDYISENYASPLSLAEISKFFSVSEEHLSRKFKRKTGVCISEFINFIRVSRATELLKAGNVSVTKVAEKCGFNDSNYFSTVFKKLHGISPKQFSLQYKKQK